jgi:hypothetical protein
VQHGVGGVLLEQQRSDIATLPAATACNVLMIYPRFMADSFWNFSEACELVGARYPAIPLGLITVAALLPKSWNVRLVNRNTEELAESDLAWANMVMTRFAGRRRRTRRKLESAPLRRRKLPGDW